MHSLKLPGECSGFALVLRVAKVLENTTAPPLFLHFIADDFSTIAFANDDPMRPILGFDFELVMKRLGGVVYLECFDLSRACRKRCLPAMFQY